jgi:serine protease
LIVVACRQWQAAASTLSKESTMRSIHCSLIAGLLASVVAGIAPAATSVDVSDASKQVGRQMAAVQYRPAQPPVQSSFNRFIVKYRNGSSASRSAAVLQQSVDAAAGRAKLVQARTTAGRVIPVSLYHVRKMAVGSDVIRSSRPLNAVETAAFLDQLRADPAVAYAQPDYIKFKQDVIPNDTHFADLQWDLTDPVAGVGAPTAWDTSTGAGVVVAVIDTGYVDHADLAANIVPGYDFISWYGQVQDGDTYPDVAGDGDGRDADAHDAGDWLDGSEPFCGGTVSRSSWHGTHVAGTIAAVTNNAYGIAGIAHGAKVQPVRVLGHCGGLTSDISDGIIWASGGYVPGVPENPTPAEVLNMSLGGYSRCSDDPATQDAINGAISRGVTVVVAAGNSNMNAAQFSPASCSGVITVGAAGIDGGKSYYSNYGTVVALAAPGGNAQSGADGNTAWIWSLGNSGSQAPVPSPAGDVLRGMVGTSMASPHVAAVVALMQSASVGAGHGALTPATVRSVLKAKVKPFAILPSVTTPIGPGMVDAAASVAAAAAGIGEEDLTTLLTNRLPITGQAAAAGEGLYYRLNVPANVSSLTVRTYGGAGDVSLYVGAGSVPTPTSYTAASVRPGTTEALVLNKPAAGVYYVLVQANVVSSGVSVLVAY